MQLPAVRFTLVEIMIIIAIEAAILVETINSRHLIRLPIINMSALAVLVAYKVWRVQARMTLGRWVVAVSVAAAMIGGAYQGSGIGLRCKEELRARQGVVLTLRDGLDQARSKFNSLDVRIKADNPADRDPRYDRWILERSEARSSIALGQAMLLKYERLANRPWEPYPEESRRPDYMARYYLPIQERDCLNRFVDQLSACFWSSAGAAATVAFYLSLILLLGLTIRRLFPGSRSGG